MSRREIKALMKRVRDLEEENTRLRKWWMMPNGTRTWTTTITTANIPESYLVLYQ